ncbi:pimeloyl-ACP methyl ester carboxylesterase [Saccharothrix carnea]|uniref:Pimeloyl-ACP methyl ester carboxylesterase n=1 Tax=Saccharothrix carnea TaxID=1280637 RepID=A0A2P8I1D1_SACCR|nr:alpha/beta fold hydrolase [Saccharothrix carnea]PSL52278.1 pimeloyl-ACP methyl ester carboxylesterase [Saccharothrix carnea]
MIAVDETPSTPAERPARRRRGPRWSAGAVAVLVAAVLFVAYVWQPPAVEGYRSPYLDRVESLYVDSPVARFHYTKTGQGTPVVLVAGGAQWLYSFRDTIPVLAENHTVYAVDLPGQGYTEAVDGFPYTFPAMADALGSFLDAVGVERASLVGHSWGGAWSLSFVERHPQRVDRLVLLDSPGLDEEPASQTALFDVPVVGEAAVKLMRRTDFETSLRSAFAHRERVDAEVVDETWAWLSRPERRAAFVDLVRNQDFGPIEQGLGGITARTLVVWGQDDRWLPASYAHEYGRRIPGAEVRVVPGAGHNVHEDDPARVSPILAEFLLRPGRVLAENVVRGR